MTLLLLLLIIILLISLLYSLLILPRRFFLITNSFTNLYSYNVAYFIVADLARMEKEEWREEGKGRGGEEGNRDRRIDFF